MKKYCRFWTIMVCIISLVFTPLLFGGVTASAATISVVNDGNLALGKPASADSEEASKGNVAANGNDGDLLTRWTANDGELGHWWMVDLGSAQPLTGTEVKWEHSTIYKYKIDVSGDNVTWNPVVDQTANTVSNQTNHDNFTANGRYVRITITGLPDNEWASFYEFKVFGENDSDTNAPDTSAYYRIKNSNSGKLMDIGGGSVSNGAADIQWSDNKGINQQWQFTATGDGYYKIINRKSGKLLQVSDSSTADGATVVQWDDNGSSNQQWKLTSLGNGNWKIENRNSGQAASIESASTADGAAVIQWPYNGGPEQQWQLIAPMPNAYTATVDPKVQYQNWEGWGTSLAWFANRVGGAPDAVRNNYADLLFGADGLNMNIVRYNIGGGENPAYPDWPTELRARVPGFQPTQGTYDWTADANQRWFLQAAKSRIASNEFVAEAFSNSPPWWMTKSGSVTGYQDGADNNLRDDMYDAFADYLVTVNQHFKDNWGVTFQTLEPVNEPSSGWNFGNRQEGSRFDPPYQERIIQKVAAKLQQQGSSTKVSASDETSIDMGRDTINSFSEDTKSVISRYNVHTYGGSDRVGFNQAAAGKNIWMSEHGDGDATGLQMSRSIIEDLRYMKASGWAYWQAVDNYGWGMLDINDINDPNSTFAYEVNKKYWAMAQWSKYIRPGYTIIDIQDENSIAAYDQASKKLVIVTLNDRDAANTVTYNLSAFSPLTGSLTGTRTVMSTSENLAPISGLSLSNNTFQYTLPEGSIATFVISDVQVGEEGTPGSVNIDGTGSGRVFDGEGVLSGGGGNTKFLIDYPEPYRSDILDYLFKPNFGASFQELKIEIGGDINSTSGTEPSHARTRAENDNPNMTRGYETWLINEAKKRNPNIKLSGLQWGAPGWVGNMWSQDNADYLVSYIKGLKDVWGYDLDYIGGNQNENYNGTSQQVRDYIVNILRPTLDRNGLQNVKIVAPDILSNDWSFANQILNDPELKNAVSALGYHYVNSTSTRNALNSGLPIWESEGWTGIGDWKGAFNLAKELNLNYVNAKITKTNIWHLINSMYNNVMWAHSGIMEANTPWSGNYIVQPAVWAAAHTTQFAEPGWKYLDSGCGVTSNGASYVTFKKPDSGDYSIVIVTGDSPESITFNLSGGLSTGAVHVWKSNSSEQFIQQSDIQVNAGSYSINLEANSIYSLTTTTGQQKGVPANAIPADHSFGKNYSEDFEGYAAGKTPKYTYDIEGAFEVSNSFNGGAGKTLRQVILKPIIPWNSWGDKGDSSNPSTFTEFGDLAWRDYDYNVDTLIENSGSVSIYGRVGRALSGGHVEDYKGYRLAIHDNGQWYLSYGDPYTYETNNDIVLASGTVPGFTADTWHNLKLSFMGSNIKAYVDNEQIASVTDSRRTKGLAGLGSGWNHAQFDNINVEGKDSPPDSNPAIPQSQMTASATSEELKGENNAASMVLDEDPNTIWHTKWDKSDPLPQSITLNLGGTYDVNKIKVLPRQGGVTNGMITAYNVYTSTDGIQYTKVTNGTWANDITEKIAEFPVTKASFIKLEATAGQGGWASAAEINVYRIAEVPVLKTKLEAMISQANQLYAQAQEGTSAGYYPVGSKSRLKSAITAAEAVMQDGAAMQEAVDAAVAALTQAVEKFKKSVHIDQPTNPGNPSNPYNPSTPSVPKNIDKTALNQTIADAKAKYAAAVEGSAPGEYKAGAKKALQTAIDAAVAVQKLDNATQQQLNEAAAALKRALTEFMNQVVFAGGSEGNGGGQETIAFKDMQGHWSDSVVARAAALGIVKGFADGTFRPNQQVTREQFVSMLARALQLSSGSAAGSGTTSFKDDDQISPWAKSDVTAAVDAKLIQGFQDGAFRPALLISRTQLAVLAARAAGLEPQSAEASQVDYADSNHIPSWAKAEVAAATAAHFVQGKDEDRFDPLAAATRAEAVKVILAVLDYMGAGNGKK